MSPISPPHPRKPAIAFFDIPYHSRLSTTLPVVRALVRRGHPVSAFTLEPYRELVTQSGAAVEIQPDFCPDDPKFTVNLRAIDYAMQAVPALLAAMRRLRPSLIILTPKCLWAAVAAEQCGIPTAVLHTNALWPRDTPISDAVRAVRWPGKREADIASLISRDRAAWAECRERFGSRRIAEQDVVPEIPNCMNLRGDLNIVYADDHIQPHRAHFDQSFHFTGPCYDSRPLDCDPGLEAALATLPRPLIFASLGSMALYNERLALFEAIIAAARAGGFGAVVAAGSDRQIGALEAPAGVLIRGYVPQLAVLAQASLFITHAGSNSVYESLLAGVPLLMLPQGGDQPIMAERMEALGLGRWLRMGGDISAGDLSAAISQMLVDGPLRVPIAPGALIRLCSVR
jgi:MGT family glycosyltransferase